MDTEKWKSVLVPVPVYREIKEIAQMEDRSISGQLRKIFKEWKEDRIAEAAEIDQNSLTTFSADESRGRGPLRPSWPVPVRVAADGIIC